MHETANKEMRKLLNKYLTEDPKTVLDVGSYDVNGTYREFFHEQATTYFGCDIRKGPNVDFVIEPGGKLPSQLSPKGDGWPLIISGSTLEHCQNPFKTVQTIADALAPGGLFIANAPFQWHYHEHPQDFFRFTQDGLRQLCLEAGLEVLEAYIVENSPTKSEAFVVARKPS